MSEPTKTSKPQLTRRQAPVEYRYYDTDDEGRIHRLVDGRFFLVANLGGGASSEVFIAADVKNRSTVVLKLASYYWDDDMFKNEVKVYKALVGCTVYFPRSVWAGVHEERPVIVLQQLGPSLHDIEQAEKDELRGPWPVESVRWVAISMLLSLQALHERGYLHRDLSLGNILTDFKSLSTCKTYDISKLIMRDMKSARLPTLSKKEACQGRLYLSDFGLAQPFIDKRGSHVPQDAECDEHTGTVRFSSHRADGQTRLSRRDDIESLAYILIHLLKGSLPWEEEPGADPNVEDICAMKRDIDPHVLCADLPGSVLHMLKYARGMTFEEAPIHYSLTSSIFNDAGFSTGSALDVVQ